MSENNAATWPLNGLGFQVRGLSVKPSEDRKVPPANLKSDLDYTVTMISFGRILMVFSVILI